MKNLHISLAAETLFKIGKFSFSNSFIVSLLISLFLIIFAFWFKEEAKKENKSNLYLFSFFLFSGIFSFFKKTIGKKKAKQFFPLLAGFFIFITLNNWSGLLPGMGTIGFWQQEKGHRVLIPFLRGGTADLNSTFALAIFSVLASQYFAIKNLGLKKYLKKYLNFSDPIKFFVGILESISEMAKIMSFSFRLFGNIFAGEVLLTVMLALLPFLAPLPFLGLEIFVGFIQAFVFTSLSLVFSSVISSDEDNNSEVNVNNINNVHKEVNYGSS